MKTTFSNGYLVISLSVNHGTGKLKLQKFSQINFIKYKLTAQVLG